MTIDILGLGESLSLYKPSQNITLGVNDIFRKQNVDYLVCIDKRAAFNDERLKVIDESKPKAFYSQLTEWSNRKDFNKIELQNSYPNIKCNIDLNEYPKSVYSPFVAIAIAFKLFNPKIINLYGVDFKTHIHLSTKDNTDRILKHTQNLKNALSAKGCQLIVFGDGILTRLE